MSKFRWVQSDRNKQFHCLAHKEQSCCCFFNAETHWDPRSNWWYLSPCSHNISFCIDRPAICSSQLHVSLSALVSADGLTSLFDLTLTLKAQWSHETDSFQYKLFVYYGGILAEKTLNLLLVSFKNPNVAIWRSLCSSASSTECGQNVARAAQCRILVQSSPRCLFQMVVLLEGSLLLKAKSLSADYLPMHQQSETCVQPKQAGGIIISELDFFFNLKFCLHFTVNQTVKLNNIDAKKVVHSRAYLQPSTC